MATKPTPMIVTRVTADNIINAQEAQSTTVTLSAVIQDNGTTGFDRVSYVVIRMGSAEYTSDVVDDKFEIKVKVSDLQAAANNGIGTFKAEGQTLFRSVLFDETLSYKIDTSAPDETTTSITLSPVTGDNLIDVTESQQATTEVKGKVSGEFTDGDKVTVTVNGQQYVTTINGTGEFAVAVNTGDLVADNSISATVSAKDEAGNVGQISTAVNYSVDAVKPTVSISIDDAVLAIGETATVTFAFSKVVKGFDLGDVIAPNVALSNLQTADGGKTWTATMSPNDKTESAQNMITVPAGSYSDAAGNVGETGHSSNYIVDTIAPNPGKLNAPDDTTDTTPVISGSGAEAGATVSVVITDKAGTVIETLTTTVDAGGAYSVEPTTALAVGDYVATATLTDGVGNTATVTDDGSVVNAGSHHKVWTVASSWNESTGPVDYAGMITGDGNDRLEIGNGAKNCWTYAARGNLWNKNPWAGWAVVSTGAGDDVIDLGMSGGYGNMFSYTAVETGIGNDTFNLAGNIHGNARVDMSDGDDALNVGVDIDDCAKVDMGAGNDTVTVGEDIENKARLNLGAGDDTLKVARYIEDNARIDFGSGSDTATVAGIHNSAKLYFRDGTNAGGESGTSSDGDRLEVSGNIHGSSVVEMGSSNDVLTVGEDIDGRSSISMGAGSDLVTVGEDIEDCVNLSLGNGNDTLQVARYVENHAKIDFGQGDDTAVMAGLNNSASLKFGSGSDTLTISQSFGHGWGSATVDMEEGDDVVNYGGKTLDGVILGGSGIDVLNLTYNADSSLTEKNCHVTNLSSKNIRGIEIIDMQGTNAVDIRYSDLLADGSNETPLYIQGGSEDKVDLGSNNWNSDSASQQNLTDKSAGGSWWSWSGWAKTGSETVDNVTYDVYRHSSAGSDGSNDVYIQQGVVVI